MGGQTLSDRPVLLIEGLPIKGREMCCRAAWCRCFFSHARETDCVAIVKTPHDRIFVIPGLTRGSTGSPP